MGAREKEDADLVGTTSAADLVLSSFVNDYSGDQSVRVIIGQ